MGRAVEKGGEEKGREDEGKLAEGKGGKGKGQTPPKYFNLEPRLHRL